MKINKNKFLVTILLMINVSFIVAQNKRDEKELVTDFIKSVFFEKNTTEYIADHYIYFEPINNTKYTLSDRLKILKKHLRKVKKEKKILLDSTDLQFVSYESYKEDKVMFPKASGNIFIFLNKNNPIMYFYLKNDKIYAFDYIMKGDEGLFITY